MNIFSPASDGNSNANLNGQACDSEFVQPSYVGTVDIPNTIPVGFLESHANSEHVIRVFDSAQPQRRSLPENAIGFDVYQYVGDCHPTTDDDFELIRVSSNMSCTISFDNDNIGRIAFYKLRWVNNDGVPGRWSDVISGEIQS